MTFISNFKDHAGKTLNVGVGIAKAASFLTKATFIVGALIGVKEVGGAYLGSTSFEKQLSTMANNSSFGRQPFEQLEGFVGVGPCIQDAQHWSMDCVIGADNAKDVNATNGVKPVYGTLEECLEVHDENGASALQRQVVNSFSYHNSFRRLACHSNEGLINVSFSKPGDFNSIQIHLGKSFSPVMRGFQAHSRDVRAAVPLYGNAKGGLMRADGLEFEQDGPYSAHSVVVETAHKVPAYQRFRR